MSRMMIAKDNTPRTRIDDEKFVKVWAKVYNKGGSIHDVAEELGCSPAGAKMKCKRLVEDGIPLPKLARAPRAKNQRDVKGLKEILKAELAKK